MAGTKAGGKAASYTNKAKYGADFYARIGSMGGKKRVPKGFALRPDIAREAGAKGGSVSKRRPAAEKVIDNVLPTWTN